MTRGEYVELPGLGRAFVRLLSRSATTAIEAEVFDKLPKAGIPAIQLHAYTYDQERKALTIAAAARDPEDHSKPFGTLIEWQQEDDDIIAAAGMQYDAVKARLDPVGLAELDPDTESMLVEAFKKKDRRLLMLFDVATLASWLTSGAVQLSSSPIPASNTGPLLEEL